MLNSVMTRVGSFFNWLTHPDTSFIKSLLASTAVAICLLVTISSTWFAPWITIMVTAVAATCVWVWKMYNPAEVDSTEEVDLKPAGLYFDNFDWHWKVRPVVCLLVGFLIALVAYLVTSALILYGYFSGNFQVANHPFDWRVWMLVILVCAIYFWFTGAKKDENGNVFVVPGTKKAALIGWQGQPRLPYFPDEIYLESSEYEWLGKELGFGPILPADDNIPARSPFVDNDGFFNMGDVQFTVWDKATAEKDSPERGFISAPTKNDAMIFCTFTMIFNIMDPRMILDSTLPAFDLGERARQEFREFTIWFVDTDIPKLHQVLGDVLTGGVMVTCFIGKPVEGRKAGSMIRDRFDQVMFEVVDAKDCKTQEEKDNAIKSASEKLAKEIARRGNVKMMEKIVLEHDDGSKEIEIKPVELKNPIGEVIRRIGCKLARTSISDVKYSDAVTDAANRASAEEFQRISMLSSADATKAYRKKLLPDPDEVETPGFELRTILGAATDPGNKGNNVRVIWTPTSNSLMGAAVVGASELKGDS